VQRAYFSVHLFDHGRFVAVRKLDAQQAISPDLDGEVVAVYFGKAELFKKIRLVGEGKNFGDVECLCFCEGGIHQLGPDLLVLVLRVNRQRADFRQVLPAELQGAAADHAVVPLIGIDQKISEVIVKPAQGARQEFTAVAVHLEQFVNHFDVFYFGFANHGKYL